MSEVSSVNMTFCGLRTPCIQRILVLCSDSMPIFCNSSLVQHQAPWQSTSEACMQVVAGYSVCRAGEPATSCITYCNTDMHSLQLDDVNHPDETFGETLTLPKKLVLYQNCYDTCMCSACGSSDGTWALPPALLEPSQHLYERLAQVVLYWSLLSVVLPHAVL